MGDQTERSDEKASGRRWLVRLVYLAFVALSLVGGLFAWLYYDLLTNDALEQAIAEADSLDPGWRLEELEARRIVIPPEQNAAMYVLKSTQLLSKFWPGTSANDATEAYQLLSNISVVPPQFQLTEEQTQDLRTFLKRANSALAEANRLRELSWGRYNVKWQLNPVSQYLPCQEAHTCANVLQLQALLQSQEKKPDDALDTTRAIINAGRSIGDEPSLISQLIRMGNQGSAVAAYERILSQGNPTNAAVLKSQEALTGEAAELLMLHAARGERAHFHRMMEAIRNGSASFAQINATIGTTPRSPSPLERWSDRTVTRQNHGPGLHLLNLFVEIAKLPVEQHSAELRKLGAENPKPPLLVGLQWPAFEKVFQAFSRSQARVRTAFTAMALERFRQSKNHWPDTLNEVVTTGFLSKVPLDPYDRAPLRYRRTKDGVIVYSVGPDRKDDGGKINPGNPTANGADLVFRLWDVDKQRQPPPPKPKDRDETQPISGGNGETKD